VAVAVGAALVLQVGASAADLVVPEAVVPAVVDVAGEAVRVDRVVRAAALDLLVVRM
jgi:hypothetical protein